MRDAFVSTIIQCSIFIGVPWIVYILFGKEKKGFFRWIGLYKPLSTQWIKPTIIVFIMSIIIMAGTLHAFIRLGGISEEMLNSLNLQSKGFSLNTVVIVLTKAIFQTALSEEILFRGFIGKRVGKKFGYITGNLTQAVLFGIPHGLPFIIAYKAFAFGFTFFASAAIVGFMNFYLNEKKADGSIIPSLLIHSTMNILSFL
jgi:membrane protease YdiL (CAAX protease family)